METLALDGALPVHPGLLYFISCVCTVLLAMLDDPEWQLPKLERGRVLDGLAYVADVEDLVPDNVPVLGLVDDAIMLELLLR